MTKERGERGTRTHAEVGDDRREPIVLARKDARRRFAFGKLDYSTTPMPQPQGKRAGSHGHLRGGDTQFVLHGVDTGCKLKRWRRGVRR